MKTKLVISLSEDIELDDIVYLKRSNEVLCFSKEHTRTKTALANSTNKSALLRFQALTTLINKMSRRFSKSAGYWESIIELWTVKKINLSLMHFSDYFLCCKCLANLPVQMCWPPTASNRYGYKSLIKKSQTVDLNLSKIVELCIEPSKTFWTVVHGIWNVGRWWNKVLLNQTFFKPSASTRWSNGVNVFTQQQQ